MLKKISRGVCTSMTVICVCFVLAFIIGGNFEFLIGYITSNVGAPISENIGSLSGPIVAFVTSNNIILYLFILFLLLSIIITLLYKFTIKVINIIKK